MILIQVQQDTACSWLTRREKEAKVLNRNIDQICVLISIVK